MTSPSAGALAPAPTHRKRPIGLLLVAVPVLLVVWLIIWPIIAAMVQTVWLPTPNGGRAISVESYQFFASDPYSRANLVITLWTTAVCAVLLLIVCLPIALYLRFSNTRLAA